MPKIYLLFFFFLICAVALRIALYIAFERPQPLQLLGEVVFKATLEEGSRPTEKGQMIKIANLKIYPDGFEKYYAGDTIAVSGVVDEKGRVFRPKIEKVSEASKASKILGQFRDKISSNINKSLPRDEAGLVSGMVMGVDELSYNLKQNLIKTGTIHTVVVSGQNLSIVAGFVLAISNIIGRKPALVLAIISVIFYSFLTGFEAPVVRATIMVIAGSIAYYLGRELWPIWGLVLSAFLILMLWPQALFEISFQLTFAATLGIMTLGKFMERVITSVSEQENGLAKQNGSIANPSIPVIASEAKQSKPRKRLLPRQLAVRNDIVKLPIKIIGDNTAISISAYVFTAPLLLWHFGSVSFSAPLVNILTSVAVVPVMIIGFIMAFASLVFLPLAQFIGLFAYIPAYYFLKVVEIFGAF